MIASLNNRETPERSARPSNWERARQALGSAKADIEQKAIVPWNCAICGSEVDPQYRPTSDPRTATPHIYRHDVSEDEVEQVLEQPGEDRPGERGSRIAIGQTDAGRYIRIIYVAEPDRDSVFVITAYELKGKPLKAYRRRQKRRNI